MTDKIVVLATCASAMEARQIARTLVEQRLAACINIVQIPVRSIYRWKGSVESAKEFLLIMKSSRNKYSALEREIKRLHSYDVPEIIALPIERGSRAYLKWLGESIRPARPQRKPHR
ncbi:MAG: divalent-cation tolerance protein CutA [Candidatus Acidiferrales bacterium]